ncbi:hypothetical protein H4R33_006862 [Dimargaris cristalligena]|uniref:Uncharacterized protein n=1 Tax=Dimargaris cristalligena TaxID=215637 RepID=A0A4V1J4B7_9FUNG|nr:hypothetical protein H4R33_006862 [Dimargaris cristalligena]RKP34999.1 hypothetical protein BJ085DRAFT_35040 [Dimargaris cristalligena]|eukprot:RKP34999.1 hypothetical protein BJ085DRAFT_35040 [Dimargaris cristalligena]
MDHRGVGIMNIGATRVRKKSKMRFTSSVFAVGLLGLVAFSFTNASNPGHGSDAGNHPSGESNTTPHSPGQGKNKSAPDRKADPSPKGPNGPGGSNHH